MQEVNGGLDDLLRWCKKPWSAARDQVGNNDILYRTDRWACVHVVRYDLNGDGHRHATKAILKHRTTGKLVTVFNVHLPSSGVGASVQRRARAKLAGIIAEAEGPVVVLGDLNTESESPSGARGLMRAVGVRFIRELVDVANHREPSHWNFGKNGLDDGWLDDIGVRDADVSEARLKTMHSVSDHNALLARIAF